MEQTTPTERPKGRRQPMRRCAFTRVSAPSTTLLRIGLDGAGRPFVDLLGRAPGRGIYVAADRQVFERALTPKGLGRLFRGRAQPLTASEQKHLLENTVERLERRILELVSLSKRAGVLVVGAKAVSQLREEAGLVVIAAKDVSERSRKNVETGLGADTRWLNIGSKAELGATLGREEVGVVAVRPSILSDRISTESDRLAGLSRDND